MKQHGRRIDGDDVAPRSGTSLIGSLKSIAWAFLGIRSSRTHRHETTPIPPLLLVAVAFVVVVVLVLGLMALVHWLAAGAGANPAN